MELRRPLPMLSCFATLLFFPAMTVAVLTGSAAAELTAIFPTAPLATISPVIWASENPAAASTFERKFTSLVLANPTGLPSEFASIITEVPQAAFTSVVLANPLALPSAFETIIAEVPDAALTSVILAEPTVFPTLFTSVALDIFASAEPTTLKLLYATNPAAGSSFIASEFKTGDPSWYDAMPSAVKSFVEGLATTTGAVTGPTLSGFLQPTVFRTVIQTVSAPPSSSSSGGGGGGGGGGSNGGGGGGGLSTGAQAGIGVGVGGAALIAIIAGLCFFLRRRKAKKHSTTNVAQQPEMAPAGAYHSNNQPQSPHQSQYYGGAPQLGSTGYYAQQEPKYDQAYGGTGVQPGPYESYQQPYQQPYQQSTSPPPQHNSQYYQSPPAPYGSPPPEDFYHEKSPVATTTGQPSPHVGTGALVSNTTGSSSAGHGTGPGTEAPTELSAGRTSVESIRHEMPADSRQ